MIASVGLSNLQFVDLNSPRNLFVIGVSLFLGLSVPVYVHESPVHFGESALASGAAGVLNILLSTGMSVGLIFGFLLDNVIPGTPEERGIVAWRGSEVHNAKHYREQMLGLLRCRGWRYCWNWSPAGHMEEVV
jgi:nucleobase transporter 1/2